MDTAFPPNGDLDVVTITIPRKSWRLDELAQRHGLSISMIRKEMLAGRLHVRKVGSASLVTAEDEAAWLEAMPRT
jgi:hypothetical protein